MPNWDIQLHPLTRLRIFREVKKAVFRRMDDNTMKPERGREIIAYIGKEIMAVYTPEAAKNFCHGIVRRFPELKNIEKKFRLETREKIDNVVAAMISLIISRGDFDLAENIIEEAKQMERSGEDFLEMASKKYFRDFEAALKNIQQNRSLNG